jgi:hypothetical protein
VAAERAAAAVRQPAVVAVSAAAAEWALLEAAAERDALAVRQPAEAAERDVVAVRPPAEVAERDAVRVPRPAEAVERDVVAVPQPAEAVVLDEAERQPAAWGAPAAFPASAVGLFPSLFAFPFPGLSAPGLVVLRPAVCFAHARQSSRIAWRS